MRLTGFNRVMGLGVVALGLALSAPANAALVFGIDSVFSGTAPSGSPPWVTATLTDIQANGHTEVQLVIAAANLTSTEYMDSFFMNYGGSSTLSSLHIALQSTAGGVVPGSVGQAGGYKADGTGGDFSLQFDFPSANNTPGRFVSGSSATYIISLNNGNVSSSDFLYRSTPDPANNLSTGGYYVAAHINSIGTGTVSGWDAGDPTSPSPVPAPEPATIVASALLLLPLGASTIRILRKNRAA